jgi:hypothetical protein
MAQGVNHLLCQYIPELKFRNTFRHGRDALRFHKNWRLNLDNFKVPPNKAKLSGARTVLCPADSHLTPNLSLSLPSLGFRTPDVDRVQPDKQSSPSAF